MRWHRHASSAEVHGEKRDTCGCARHTKLDGHARAREKRKHAGNYDYNDESRDVKGKTERLNAINEIQTLLQD